VANKRNSTRSDVDGDRKLDVRTERLNSGGSLAIDDAFLNRENLHRGLTDNLSRVRLAGDKVTARVDFAFADVDLSRPQQDRSTQNYVAPGASTGEVLDALVKRRVEVIEKSARPVSIAVQERSTLIDWGKVRSNDQDTPRKGTIEIDRLVDWFNSAHGGALTARAPNAVSLFQAEAKADEVLN
jgi:hypothetical protein